MQAAVAFIENVEPAALGFDEVAADVLPSSNTPASPLHARDGSSASAVETLASPNLEQMSVSDRVRSRLATDFGDIAGVSNKVITGVLGSSLTAFGRIMSGTQNQGPAMEKEREGPRTMDEFRDRVQGQSSRRGAAIGGDEVDGRRSRKNSWAKEDDARSIRSTASARPRRPTNGATDYGSAEEQAKDAYLSVNPNESKMSLGERLASIPVLGRFGMGERTQSGSSPASVTRELPVPPPPQKPAHVAETRLPASLRSPYAPLKQPPESSRPLHIVLATTGSVASIKVPLIAEQLLAYANVRIQVIATKASMHFYNRSDLTRLNSSEGEYKVQDLAEENRQAVRGTETDQEKLPRCHLWTDEDEWDQWQKVGDPILHIELRRWADVVLIAPCSADTLAKINGGICDNLLTSFLRALASSTPTLLFPAMNTLMWLHPLTARQISFVKDVLGYEVHGPIGKKLACGDLGQGAMYEWTDVVELVVKRFSLVPAEGHAEAEPVSVSTTPHTVTGISA